MACTKKRYRSRKAALDAAHGVRRNQLDIGFHGAYRCTRCRYPDGQRPWHWGHARPRGRRRTRWR